MTEKTPIREVSFRQRTDLFEQYPEMRAAAERSLYQAAEDLGFEPGVLSVRDEPATEGTAFTIPLSAMTVLTLRAKRDDHGPCIGCGKDTTETWTDADGEGWYRHEVCP